MRQPLLVLQLLIAAVILQLLVLEATSLNHVDLRDVISINTFVLDAMVPFVSVVDRHVVAMRRLELRAM